MLLPISTCLNALVLEETLGFVFDLPPTIVLKLAVWGWTIVVTNYGALGLALAVGEIILGAVAAGVWEARVRTRCVALVVLLALIGFEVGATAIRAYQFAMARMEDPGPDAYLLAVLSGFLVLICAAAEVVSGYVTIHRLLIPLFRWLLWVLTAPMRWIVHGWSALKQRHELRRGPPLPAGDFSSARPGVLSDFRG